MFNTDRGLLKFIIFSIITFGIYDLVVFSHMSEEINIIASPRDGKHTMHFLLVFFIFSWLTCYIAYFVWAHRVCNRIGDELKARGCEYDFSAEDFWIWDVLGSLIIVGPFVFIYRLLRSMNLLNADYKRINNLK